MVYSVALTSYVTKSAMNSILLMNHDYLTQTSLKEAVQYQIQFTHQIRPKSNVVILLQCHSRPAYLKNLYFLIGFNFLLLSKYVYYT